MSHLSLDDGASSPLRMVVARQAPPAPSLRRFGALRGRFLTHSDVRFVALPGASRLVTIAQIEGRVHSGGSEFVLACDMRFAARETAIFAQFESALGQIPGGGATQYLARLIWRGRALEVLLSAEDYDADPSERYGWINRALPARTLGAFVQALAKRIARFPAAGLLAIEDRVNAISLARTDDFRRDSDLFAEGVRNVETQRRIQAVLHRGLQTRQAEIEFANIVDALATSSPPRR